MEQYITERKMRRLNLKRLQFENKMDKNAFENFHALVFTDVTEKHNFLHN